MPYTPLDHNDPLVDRVRAIVSRHIGRDNRIERRRLVAMFPEGDRAIRDAINKCPEICSTRQMEDVPGRGKVGGGYFLPTCRDEALQYTASMRSRVKAINQKLAIVDDYVRNLGEYAEQMKLEV